MIGIHYLGIDIGYSNIKIAYLRQFTQKIKVMDLISFSTPKDSVEDGEIKNFDAVSSKIERTVLSEGYVTDNVYLCVNSSKAALRSFEFTDIKLNELEQAVKFELSKTYPDILETNKVSIKVYEKNKNKISGFAAFCPKKILRGYEMLGASTVLKVKGIDVSPNAVGKAFSYYNKTEKGKPYLIVDIGSANSQVILLEGKKNYLSRIVYAGGNTLDEMIADKYHITQSQANEYKVDGYKKLKLSDKEISENTKNAYAPIVEQIQQTVKYYDAKKTNKKIEKIYLSGGGANKKLVEGCCKDVLPFPCEMITLSIKDEELKDKSKNYLDAIGCALRGV